MLTFIFANSLYLGIVIATVFVLWLLWIFLFHLEVRRSLRWWQTRQNQRLLQAAAAIRDGLLQDSFVVRRNLELLLTHPSGLEASGDKKCLTALEQLHASLKELSNCLSPSYLETSFPLAVEHILDEWRSQFPNLTIAIKVAPDWQHATNEYDQFILMLLQELLRLTLDNSTNRPSFYAINADLRQYKNTIYAMEIEFGYLDILTLKRSLTTTDLRYLKRIFHLITEGQCWYRQHDLSVTWYFRW